MQLDKKHSNAVPAIDLDALRSKIAEECAFITDILSRLPRIIRQDAEETEGASEERGNAGKWTGNRLQKGTARAHSIEELQEKIKAIRDKKKQGYRDLVDKKKLKNTLKKKRKADERNLKHKQMKLDKQAANGSLKSCSNDSSPQKPSKPVFNSEGKMVFSKFDFSDIGSNKEDKKKKKESKDPRKILEKLKEKKERLRKLQTDGQTEKALMIKQKEAWSNVLKKAEGVKVKTDPELLKKTLKREEAKKRQSAKKWASREHGKKKSLEDRINKRNTNIQARKDLVKKNKKQKAIKKGRIMPGF